jgi:dolichyl-phosphooligosaccharide-protein glycotransferase
MSEDKQEQNSKQREVTSDKPQEPGKQEVKKENKTQEIKEEKVQEPKENKQEKERDDDEDISLDFSKIINLFKAKKETKKSQEEKNIKDNNKSEKEKSIEYKKAEKENKKQQETEDDQEEINIDTTQLWGKAKKFWKQHHALLIVLIPLLFCIFLRVQPFYLPSTDSWAQTSLDNALRQQEAVKVSAEFPSLSPEKRDELAGEEVAKFKTNNKAEYNAQLNQISNQFKQGFQDPNGQTYLLAIDPYFWMRYARNIVEKGHIGDEVKEGKQWDNHMLAPLGKKSTADPLHAYFEAYLFKFLRFFNRDLSLMTVAFFVPVIVSALAILAIFFLARRATNTTGAFFAALILALHPTTLNRTIGGFSDTDAYTLLFPLLIFWFFIESLTAEKTRKKLMYGALCGASMSLYSLAWIGWWYMFDFIVAITCLYFIVEMWKERKQKEPLIAYGSCIVLIALLFITSTWNVIFSLLLGITGIVFAGIIAARLTKKKLPFPQKVQNNLLMLGSIILTTGILVPLFRKAWISFTYAFSGPIAFITIKEAVKSSSGLWPNVLTTVAELNESSISNAIRSLGSPALLFLVAMGIALLLYNWYEKQDTKKLVFAFLIIIWLGSTVYASQKGVRFLLLAVPPFALAVGIGMGELCRYAEALQKKVTTHNLPYLKKFKGVIKRIPIKIIPALLILLFLSVLGFSITSPPCKGGMCNSAMNSAKSNGPSFDDAWYNTLVKIKESSQEDAIINSWWDFGHWFKFWADRAVTFDGASQATPQAHWIGKVLLTHNEKEAVGILRMLDCGGNTAFDKIEAVQQDTVASVDLIYELIIASKEAAQKKLTTSGFTSSQAQDILSSTHCSPPENFFITSEDMVGKSGVWGHFGSWSFRRAKIWTEFKNANMQKALPGIQALGYTEEKSQEIYQSIQGIQNENQANSWISPWPSYFSHRGCQKQEGNFVCVHSIGNQQIPFIVDVSTGHVEVPGAPQVKPHSVVYPARGDVQETVYKNQGGDLNVLPYSLVVIPNGDLSGAESVIVDKLQSRSMFTRLFYFNGLGSKHFKKFNDQEGITGVRIITWKVDWDGQ